MFPSSRSLLVAICMLVFAGNVVSAQAARTDRAHSMTVADARTLASLHVSLLKLQDSLNAEMAHPRNKTAEGQVRLQEQLRTQVQALIARAGLTDDEYERRRYVLSTSDSVRSAFDEEVAKLTGTPSRAAVATAAAAPAAGAVAARPSDAAATMALPAGPVGAHIGHVMVRFGDTPENAGLLATARAEAEIAVQHATLAARTPTDLRSMQRHAGHVIHAIDPSLVASGPGKGYGLNKAATAVATHIEMAASAENAPAAVRTHAAHVATAARSTVSRAAQVIALATRVQEATDAAAASELIGQLASLAEQLVAGADLDADGRIMWNNGEGGLQQAEAHMQLMLGALSN